ncbi:MAG: threonine--tRNA ligase [Oscillospiraceae bacterium]|nr:threonine--tRNA ligase [Oscillospiraceae bacterium]
MMKIKLIDGSEKELEAPIKAIDAVKHISQGLAKSAIAVYIDGKLTELNKVLISDCELRVVTFDDEEGRKIYRHTASHILAQAVKRLYPQVKLTIGPAIDNGFYYDFDSEISFTPDILAKLEKEMNKIIAENLPLERFTLSREDALKFMEEKGEPYKVELINDLPENEEISFYKQGDFVDLCAGLHLISTGKVKAVKLTACTGAYWRGDSNKKMLQRIYGTAFPSKEELESYITQVEEAKKRDHNKLGRELEYFTTVDMIGQGLPILMPKGARVIQLLQRFVEDEEQRRGYLLTKTPFMAKRDLYKISGHWDHYRDNMFIMGDPEAEGEVFALRPMTCPFQFMVYLNKKRSYRDLPMRLNETSTLFRNEASGEMHGLIRVRQFTISEGHIACMPEQLESEFAGALDLARYMLSTLGLDDEVSYRFSKWDENDKAKYIGSPEEWESVQNRMRVILNDLKINYKESAGEAAFYGPKLDIQIKNVHGKEDTLITIQIDFQLASRFGMVYTDADGQQKYPYVIHRTSIGCYERTLALLIEKYAGAFPTWLAPVQVQVLPISERQAEYADSITKRLSDAGIRTECDKRSEKIGYKIREAQLQKVPYMLVVGDKEQESGIVAVRSRKNGDMGTKSLDEFLSAILLEVAERVK